MHSLESFILETQSTVARSAQQSSMENSPIPDIKMTVSRVPPMWSLREESGDLISQKGFSQTSSSSIRVGKEPQLTKNKDKGDCYL